MITTKKSMKSFVKIVNVNEMDDYRKFNEKIYYLTGIVDFFENDKDKKEFLKFYDELAPNYIKEREFGDYQTPLTLTDKICIYLVNQGCNPEVIIEPTFGKGNFIQSSLKFFSNTEEIYGIEIQKKYVWLAKFLAAEYVLKLNKKNKPEIKLIHDSIFDYSFENIDKEKEILIIGNPPWVTNAELGSINSKNIPRKSNFKKHKGLEAITGKANFDISEFIILQLMERFKDYNGTFAMLCKNSVAKNIIKQLPDNNYKITDIKLLEINTREEFNVATDASLFYFKFGKASKTYICETYSMYEPNKHIKTFGWVGDKFVSDVKKYSKVKEIDNSSSLIWRSGIKHDASKVMELKIEKVGLVNGFKEKVDIEDTLVYKLLKSSDLKGGLIKKYRKAVIVTQKNVGEDTSYIKNVSPKLWDYLNKNKEYFDKRKSTIYRNKPPFSIFGIGDYSFANYKVAISGMYKKPNFSLIIPYEGKPVMLDDTCYFLSFDNLKYAIFTYLILNNTIVQDFLKSIVFPDEKRPYTKEVLMRIDLYKCTELLSFNDINKEYEKYTDIPKINITESDWNQYKLYVLSGGNKGAN